MKITPTPTRRFVYLDIETISTDPANAKGALTALSGRLACVCLLIDDGETVVEEAFIDTDEATILEQFWSAVRATDVFLGHNALDFDLPFLRQRSWILGIRPSRRVNLRRYYTEEVIDTMQLWSNWGASKYISLDALAGALGCGAKTGHGSDVAGWWTAGDLEKIAAYCRDDVRLSYQVFCRLMFKPIPERYLIATGYNQQPPQSTALSPATVIGKLLPFPVPQADAD